MFPAVVVDLGPEVSRTETSWVLEACNAAIPRGSCVLDADLGGALPRAVAIVRAEAGGQRAVRIEVGLRDDTHDHWSVRDLEFAAHDPPRERWRSVGLVLATLVGRVEAQQAREAGEPAPAEMNAPAGAASIGASNAEAASALPNGTRGEASASVPNASTSAAGDSASPTRGVSSAEAAASNARNAAPPLAERSADRPSAVIIGVDEAAAPASNAQPLPRPNVFLGAGVLAAPGQSGTALRWGGGIRGGWISDAGWMVQGSGDYSSLSLPGSAVELSWWRISASVGHRWWAATAWSFDFALGAGVQDLRASSPEAGSLPGSAWSPLVVGSGDLWWQIFAAGGAWVGFDLSSIGRSARVRGRDGEALAFVPVAESHALLGLWWAP